MKIKLLLVTIFISSFSITACSDDSENIVPDKVLENEDVDTVGSGGQSGDGM